MSFSSSQDTASNSSSNSGISNTTTGLDVFGTTAPIKKNKGIISRMKRSLSTSGRPPQPLPLKLPSSSLLQTTSLNEWNATAAPRTPSPYFTTTEHQHNKSPSYNLSSPIPKSNGATHYFGASPTTHLSYETFASSSASNLSIRSFPSSSSTTIKTRRSSDTTTNTTNKRTIPNSHSSLSFVSNNEKLQAKSMFESRLIENEKVVSMTKLVSATNADNSKRRGPYYEEEEEEARVDSTLPAPAPAMYWSCPEMFGKVKPPKLRAHSSVVYGDKMYVYGGTSKSKCSDTLYILELDTFSWSIPHVYGITPPACRAHCLTIDNESGKIYLFGGGDGQKYYNHLYILDTFTMIWSKPKTIGSKPSERRAHVVVIWKNGLYVFGGGDGTKALNDTHRLDLRTKEWKLLNTSGTKPTSRGYHTGNLVGNKLVVLGGSDGKECFGEIHVLDLESEIWFSAMQDDPQQSKISRLSHSAICIGSFLFVIAGHDGTKYCNDLFMLNLVNMTWETRKVYGQAPTPRGYHTTVLYDSRIFLFGGYNGTSFSNEVYILDLSSFAYLPQIVNFTIDL